MQPSLTSPQPPLSPELRVPEQETPPKGKAKGANILLPKALVDDLYREARKNFALIPDMTFALAAGGRALRDMWEHKDGKFTRKERPFAAYIPPRESDNAASLNKANANAEVTETPAVAAARARWDEAKREGDAGSMTRAANDLLRAMEADRAGGARASIDVVSEPLDEPDAAIPSHTDAEFPRPGSVEFDVDELALVPGGTHEAPVDDPQLLKVQMPEGGLNAGVSSIPAFAAAVTANGTLTGVTIESPGSQYWGPTNKQAASAVIGRIAAIGDAIQKHGTAEQKEAWKQLKKIILEDNPASMRGVAQNEGDTLRVDLSRMGAGANPKKAPDPNFVMFMLVHEIFHSAKSDRAAQAAARKMQGGEVQNKVPKIGTPQWSAEVRLDKRVYEFLVMTGLLGEPPPPIQVIAPYYYEHLKNPQVPVHVFPGVPGYDQPLN
jgi:hypothetical protein